MDVSKNHFLSTKLQKLMLETYEKKIYFSFKSQEIFRSQRSFNIAMLTLFNTGIVKKNMKLSKSGFYDQFEFTISGEIFINLLRRFYNGI